MLPPLEVVERSTTGPPKSKVEATAWGTRDLTTIAELLKEETMRSKAWLRFAGVGAAALLALTGCGGGGDGGEGPEAGGGQGEITIWGHQGQEFEVEALQKAVNEFNSSQTDVKATLRLIPEADYTKTLTATSPSELPDVLEFDGPLMSSFVYASKL